MNHRRVKNTSMRLVRFLGPWNSLCILLCLSVLALAYLSTPGLRQSDSQRLISLVRQQQLITERLDSNSMAIELGVLNEDWDDVGSAAKQLIQDRRSWIENQDTISTNRLNSFTPPGATESIADQVARSRPAFTTIDGALDELELLATSVERRAPYIDQPTKDRIIAASDVVRENEPHFSAGLEQIGHLYTAYAAQKGADSIAGVRRWYRWTFLSFMLLVLTGIVPALHTRNREIARLRDSTTHAEHITTDRWNLLGSLGYQFRTPMSSIMGFASLLADEQQDPETKVEYAQRILDAGDGLMTLVGDILDLSAIESHELSTTRTHTDPRQILHEIESTHAPIALEKGIEFQTFCDDSCPLVETDAKRLRQILGRVVDNAIRFTDMGSIEVHALIESRAGREMLVIRVVDTGIGLSPDDLQRVFEPFERIETGGALGRGGAGLGLTVARSLARELGGDVTIESALGAGSFVTITIDPGECLDASSESAPTTLEMQGVEIDQQILESCWVLLVEDGEDNKRLLTHFLTRAGCSVQTTDNGQAAIDRIKLGRTNAQPFDLILMDIQLPVLDGLEATAILREEGVTTPIIGISAHATAEDRVRCLNAGCTEFLTKPVDREELLSTCMRLVQEAKSQGPLETADRAA